jgi:hypothetical protein
MKDRNREYILELFKIVSPTSILVVDQHGKLKRLHCPFRVIAIVDIPPYIEKGKFYMVDFVKMTLELKDVFIIAGKGYCISGFRIKG